MWSTCSIDTGHSRTQAPQVTQSQTTLSVTAPGTSGCGSKPSAPRSSGGPSSKTWSRRAMISSFGDSSLPVVQAGQTSWQRPHSVHENVSSVCFQVRSRTVPAPKRISSSGPSKRSGSSRPRARVRAEEHVHRRGGDVQVLRVREVGEEA